MNVLIWKMGVWLKPRMHAEPSVAWSLLLCVELSGMDWLVEMADDVVSILVGIDGSAEMGWATHNNAERIFRPWHLMVANACRSVLYVY